MWATLILLTGMIILMAAYRTPLSVASVALAGFVWWIRIRKRNIKYRETPEEEKKQAELDGVNLKKESFLTVAWRMILVLTVLSISFFGTQAIAPGFLLDWPGQNVRLYEAMTKAEKSNNYAEVIRLISERKAMQIGAKERNALEVKEVQVLIDWGLYLSENNRWPEAVDKWMTALPKTKEYKQQAQQKTVENLLRPTPTPYPTLTPAPTPTVIPTPMPIVLTVGSYAELIREETSVNGTVFYIRVLKSNGSPVTGLTAKDVYADGARITVRDLDVNPQPISLIIAIDGSGSMLKDGVIDRAKEGAIGMVNTLRGGDQVNILVFQGMKVTTSGFLDKSAAVEYISTIRAINQAQTPLYDGVVVAIQQGLKVEKGRRVTIVILSDGKDTSSVLITNPEDVAELVSNTSFDIYPIRFGSDNEEFFSNIASAGLVQVLETPDQINGAFETISNLFGKQYAIEVSGEKPAEITIGGGKTAITLPIP